MGLKSNNNKKTTLLHVQHLFCTFLCRCFAWIQRRVKMSYMFLFAVFSLPLIFTLSAARISHILIAGIKFSCFSSIEIRFLFFISRSISFSVIHVIVVVLNETVTWHRLTCRGWTDVRTDGQTGGHVITKFSGVYKLPFFLTQGAPLRAITKRSLVLYEKLTVLSFSFVT